MLAGLAGNWFIYTHHAGESVATVLRAHKGAKPGAESVATQPSLALLSSVVCAGQLSKSKVGIRSTVSDTDAKIAFRTGGRRGSGVGLTATHSLHARTCSPTSRPGSPRLSPLAGPMSTPTPCATVHETAESSSNVNPLHDDPLILELEFESEEAQS